METVKKILSLLISFIIVFSCSQIVGYAAVNTEISNEQFFQKVSEIVEYENSGAGISSLNTYSSRIIVKTDSNRKLNSQGAIASVEGFNCWHVFQYDSITATQAAIEYYESLSNVEYVELDCAVEAEPLVSSSEQNNTPVFDVVPSLKDWGCTAVETSAFLKEIAKFKNSPEIEVAVLDTGIDYDNPFFENSERLIDSGVNSTGTTSNDTNDNHGHGTFVAGIIYNNTPSNVKISGYKVLNDRGRSLSLFLVAQSIIIAVDNGADIINMSLGCFSDVTVYLAFEDAVKYAYNKDVPVIVAAGNDSFKLSNEVPATTDRAITVAAVNSDFTPCDFSNYGRQVDIAAPGRKINSCLPFENNMSVSSTPLNGHYYSTAAGTSFSTPFVSAAAALLKTNNPDLSVDEVESILKSSAYIPDDWNTDYGVGILNIANMIENSSAPAPVITSSGNSITITTRVPDAVIYYTTNGTEPVEGKSNVYTEPIDIDNITVVKAIVCKGDWLPSKTVVYRIRWNKKIAVRYKGSAALPISPNDVVVMTYSSNEDIATCENRAIKGHSVGEATVYVFLETGQKITYDVTVEYETWQKVIIYLLFGFLWYI